MCVLTFHHHRVVATGMAKAVGCDARVNTCVIHLDRADPKDSVTVLHIRGKQNLDRKWLLYRTVMRNIFIEIFASPRMRTQQVKIYTLLCDHRHEAFILPQQYSFKETWKKFKLSCKVRPDRNF